MFIYSTSNYRTSSPPQAISNQNLISFSEHHRNINNIFKTTELESGITPNRHRTSSTQKIGQSFLYFSDISQFTTAAIKHFTLSIMFIYSTSNYGTSSPPQAILNQNLKSFSEHHININNIFKTVGLELGITPNCLRTSTTQRIKALVVHFFKTYIHYKIQVHK